MDDQDGRELISRNGALKCEKCKQEYLIKNGVIDFLREGYTAITNKAWYEKLVLHEKWWREERSTASRTGSRAKKWCVSQRMVENYFKLDEVDAGSHGLLLDVGCGDGARHNSFFRKKYLGIDPLLHCNSYPFPFFRGVAEQLPFASGAFDVVTTVESIDHFADSVRSMKEMIRCLAPGGALFIFVGDGALHDATYIHRQLQYSVTEDEVHTRNYSMEDFACLLKGQFDKLDINREDGYVAVWGWGKRDA
ncbi:MAG: class I SAM-dependent methyltransferase [Gallionella sp.]|nr:class I SAM-dependent methyltransferase [Gallionella sp.]